MFGTVHHLYLHVRLQIIFAGTAEGAERALVALEAGVNHHVSFPVALPLNDQTTHRALKRLPSLFSGCWSCGGGGGGGTKKNKYTAGY